ncbi:MAG: hypothetical protein ACFCGT_28420 [Sandaracinaceae bacterium]
MRGRSIAIAARVALATGCARLPETPPVAHPTPVRTPLVVYERYRLAAMDFGWVGTEDGGVLTQIAAALPAALLTQLGATGRFSVYDGGSIRQRALVERNANERLDGYVSGTITSWDLGRTPARVCADVRLASAYNHEVLQGMQACFDVQVRERHVDVERPRVEALAQELARGIPQLDNARVLAAEGSLVMLDRGANAGVLRGMAAYIRATGELASDRELGELVTSFTNARPRVRQAGDQAVSSQLPAIVAELVIVSVDDFTATAERVRGDYVLRGDAVVFK